MLKGLSTSVVLSREKNSDFDFLSSLEVVILDQADVYLMQNWEHVLVSWNGKWESDMCNS